MGADTADTDPTVTDAPLPTTSRDKNIVTEVIVVVMAVILDMVDTPAMVMVMVDTPAMVMVMVDTVVTTKSINPNLKSIRSTLFFVGNLMYHALVVCHFGLIPNIIEKYKSCINKKKKKKKKKKSTCVDTTA